MHTDVGVNHKNRIFHFDHFLTLWLMVYPFLIPLRSATGTRNNNSTVSVVFGTFNDNVVWFWPMSWCVYIRYTSSPSHNLYALAPKNIPLHCMRMAPRSLCFQYAFACVWYLWAAVYYGEVYSMLYANIIIPIRLVEWCDGDGTAVDGGKMVCWGAMMTTASRSTRQMNVIILARTQNRRICTRNVLWMRRWNDSFPFK